MRETGRVGVNRSTEPVKNPSHFTSTQDHARGAPYRTLSSPTASHAPDRPRHSPIRDVRRSARLARRYRALACTAGDLGPQSDCVVEYE